MKTMTIGEFHDSLRAQGVPREHLALICPMCKQPQSAQLLIDFGAGASFDEVETFLGYSCAGRFIGSPSPRKVEDGKFCNWTLGGFFRLHKLEVVTEDGVKHPRFEIATPEQANELMRRVKLKNEAGIAL